MKKYLLIISFLASLAMASSIAAGREPEEKSLPVSIDMTADKVQEILTQHHIEYSFNKKDNSFYAIIRISTSSLFVSEENISYRIVLDDKALVKEINAKRGFTGL